MRYLQGATDVVYVYTGATPINPELPEGYAWKLLDQESVRRYFGTDDADRWRLRSYSSLLDRGYVGHLLHAGSEWAAVQWLATPASGGPRHLPRKVAAGRYWCFNEHTRETHRRRGLWQVLKDIGLRHAREACGDQQLTIFSDTGPKNTASRRAHESYGFSPAGVVKRFTARIPRMTTLSWGSWDPEAPHPPVRKIGDEA